MTTTPTALQLRCPNCGEMCRSLSGCQTIECKVRTFQKHIAALTAENEHLRSERDALRDAAQVALDNATENSRTCGMYAMGIGPRLRLQEAVAAMK